jgi:hypothetical protein
VGNDVGRPHVVLWAALGQAAPHHRWAPYAEHAVCVGRTCKFQPVDSFLNRNHFLFILISIKFKLLKFTSKYPELQKLLNQFHWIHNFISYSVKLINRTETFSLSQFMLKLEYSSLI